MHSMHAWLACHRRGAVGAAALFLALFGTACQGIFDVENPNNVAEESLNDPVNSTSLANGVGGSTTRALTAIYAPYGAATDELRWIGSRDAYKSLDDGDVSDVGNEFVDAAYFHINEARWWGDENIRRLGGFIEAGLTGADLERVSNDLARVYLYSAVMYISIADMFDDVVLAQGREATAPVGETNMSQLYDTAVEYLTSGIELVRSTGNADLETALIATRARAHFSRGVWEKVNPPGTTPADPRVSSAAAAADAQAALAMMGTDDYLFALTPSSQTLGFPIVGNDINQRLELRAGDQYIVPDAENKRVASILLLDPVDDIPDPALAQAIERCCVRAVSNFVPIVIVSAREMHLILAEHALANGQTGTFVTEVNAVRAFHPELSPYDGVDPAPVAMLEHTRRVNLFMQGRRLADHYRFGTDADRWVANSTAATMPGCFFPITVSERQANPLVATPPICQ